MSLEIQNFGEINGVPAKLFVLSNAAGTAAFTNYGATWVRWLTKDRAGMLGDVILGFDSVEAYATQTAYIGAVCGRHANRIAGGKFTLDGNEISLAINNGPNHLHGGLKGFDKFIWEATPAGTPEEPSVTFARRSPDGEENYRGNVNVRVTYTLLVDGAVRIDYHAETDAATPINLTNHCYFNLAGHASGTVFEQSLQLNAPQFLPTNETAIPTGEIWSAKGVPAFDFSVPKKLGKDIFAKSVQLKNARGYDHCYILGGKAGTLREVAKLICEETGRTMTVETTEPAMQIYTGNWLGDCAGNVTAKDGAHYADYSGVAFETQHAPDAINQNAFRANVLVPGRPYDSTTIYRPSVI